MSVFPTPLISVEQLASLNEHPDLVILDASMPPVGGGELPANRWPDTIIPNARRFDIEADFSAQGAAFPHTMLSQELFEAQCRRLGINNESLVVVYDDLGMFSSARAWYMLLAMGHQQVAVLNGGLPEWLAQGLPSSKANNDREYHTGNFLASEVKGKFCNADFVATILNDAHYCVLDARAANRFNGLVPEPRAGVRAGHMPGAVNLPYSSLLKDGKLVNREQLIEIFSQLPKQTNHYVMSCGSGVTACILALAASIVGHQSISVYDGSWAQWGACSEYPVVC